MIEYRTGFIIILIAAGKVFNRSVIVIRNIIATRLARCYLAAKLASQHLLIQVA